jgi:acyl phosphate:glycerol-3-phosphate acyltransferase
VIIGKLVGAAIIAYLLGAIPFGLIFGWLMGKVDVTKHGSRSIGSTNVLRLAGTRAAVVVIVLDLGKAILAVFLAQIIMGDDILMIAGFPLDWRFAQVLAALMVMVGHSWSIYIKFRGGKGVAAYFGGWFIMCPAAALFGGIIVIIIATLTRYVSLGSILGAIVTMILLIILTVVYGFPPIYLAYSVLGAIIIAVQHRSNIGRLQTHTERRIGDKVEINKTDSFSDPPQSS